MNPLKPAKGKLAELEDNYLKLKNKPIKEIERICKLFDYFKRNGYSDKQLTELDLLIGK